MGTRVGVEPGHPPPARKVNPDRPGDCRMQWCVRSQYAGWRPLTSASVSRSTRISSSPWISAQALSTSVKTRRIVRRLSSPRGVSRTIFARASRSSAPVPTPRPHLPNPPRRARIAAFSCCRGKISLDTAELRVSCTRLRSKANVSAGRRKGTHRRREKNPEPTSSLTPGTHSPRSAYPVRQCFQQSSSTGQQAPGMRKPPYIGGFGRAPGRSRTYDRQIRRLLLYPLSYGGRDRQSMADDHRTSN